MRIQREHARRDDETRRVLAESARAREPERSRLREEAVLLNLGAAEAVARRFAGRGVESDDLRQVAYLGLVKAVDRFDPAHGKGLLSYAVPTIRGELQRYFRDHSWMVRPTRAVQETQWLVASTEDELAQELGRQPARAEVRERAGLTESEWSAAMSADGCFHPASLDQPVGDDGSAATLGDLVRDEESTTEAAEARVMLAGPVRSLSRRSRRVITLRYVDGLTQREIGREIGVTQAQVSRILTAALTTLREQLDAAPVAA